MKNSYDIETDLSEKNITKYKRILYYDKVEIDNQISEIQDV